jgi:hypothetical protein
LVESGVIRGLPAEVHLGAYQVAVGDTLHVRTVVLDDLTARPQVDHVETHLLSEPLGVD